MLEWVASWVVEVDDSDSEKRRQVRSELRRNKRLLDDKKDDLALDLLDVDAEIQEELGKSGGKLTPGVKVLLQSKRSLVQQQAEIGLSTNNVKYLETRSTLDNSAAAQARAISLMGQLNQGLASASGQAAVRRDFERYAQQTGALRDMQGQLQDLMQADAQATADAIERGSAASSSAPANQQLTAEEQELFDRAREEYLRKNVPDFEAAHILETLPSVPTTAPGPDQTAASFAAGNTTELSQDELALL